MEHHPYRAPAPAAAPPRPKLALLGCVLAGCLVLVAFTSHKLYRMAQLRGDLPGVPERQMEVTRQVRSYGLQSMVVELVEVGVADARPFTYQVDTRGRVDFSALRGRRVAVRCVDASRECYGLESVYISDGNRAFDLCLLCVELAGFTAVLLALHRRHRAYRGAVKATARPGA